ncbi:sporulation integral membrane protein YlbJ [Sporomusa acidovorans]|uniref:Sporulation integral membrane protein YlbJ n=1 Tax=Sporomusa acidovorans (strain ATCC 49682 / DSM 3132 / Mol) TaxID=1123286 RepID=A0ABZ3J2B7_SPOA4|nr:sporulation integral membrane protein YlbJ [Sporomusa acidovorans]OZC19994.1 sporulation integral membrane protein YlbJ [Sporomusa acidovorans DSM 3132]SDD48089.1 sporulation integral membrane protein YlbJ [Sporomusa acidovorans]
MRIWGSGRRYRSRLLTYFMAFCTVFITIAMVIYPKDAFDSAIMGLNLWWNVVFPSLLPFFILSEILMGIGVVHFIGVLLEPLMRPIFNVPGVGAFAMSMGLASGYPMDAVITCRFRKNQLCTAVEAERLLSFTNTADPLFMFGAVAVGMFGMPELGATIALSHYISSFLVGVAFRFHGRNRDNYITDAPIAKSNIIIRAFRALYKARQEDKRSAGQLLGDAVKSSMNTIILIGGFIIVFSVFIRIMTVIGVTDILSHLFASLLNCITYSTNLTPALVSGFFEIDLGTLAASQANAPLIEKVAIASAIIAWSGLSVHGQVASIVIESGIRMTPYMVGRLLHAVFAAILTVLFLGSGQSITKLIAIPVSISLSQSNGINFWLTRMEQTTYQIGIILCMMIILSIAIHISKGIYHYVKK